MTVDPKHIMNLQGKEYVTYEGLLNDAHRCGLKGTRTRLVQIPTEANGNTAIVEAVAVFENGHEWSGIGDASPTNVNRMVAKHLIRMAETRAKARAYRDATNIGMTAFEELEDGTLPQELGDSPGTAPAPADPGAPATDQEIGRLWEALRKAYGEEAEATWREHIKVYQRADGSSKASTKELTSAEAIAATRHYLAEARKEA